MTILIHSVQNSSANLIGPLLMLICALCAFMIQKNLEKEKAP